MSQAQVLAKEAHRVFEAGRQSRQVEIAATMRAHDYTLEAIGQALGISRQAVHHMLATHPTEN